jgi:hypothetical protein
MRTALFSTRLKSSLRQQALQRGVTAKMFIILLS